MPQADVTSPRTWARLLLTPALAVGCVLGFRAGRFVADENIRCGTPLFLVAAFLLAIALGLLGIGLLLLIARRSRPIGRVLLIEAAWAYPGGIVAAYYTGQLFP